MEVAARRSIGRKRCQGRACFATFTEFHGSLVTTHIGFYPAGMGRVDLDGSVAELIGKVDGECVERSLRCIVGEGLGVVDGRFGVGLQGERAENAGEVDDATRRAGLEEGP